MPFRDPMFSKPLGLGDLFWRDMMARGGGIGSPGIAAPPVIGDLIIRGPAPSLRPIGSAPLGGARPPVYYATVTAMGQEPLKPDFNDKNRLNKFDGRAGYRPLYQGEAGGLTFENDVEGDPQTNRSVDARLADLLEAAAHDVVGININSTTGGEHGSAANGWRSPHYDGRAADIHRIGSMKENEGLDISDPKARHIVDGLVKYFASHPEVNQIIGPTGGWNVIDGKLYPITDRGLLVAHRDHLHVGIRR